MRKAIFTICLVSIAGCASTQSSTFTAATPGCKHNQAVVNKKTINTNFCIKKVMLKPSQYLVTINEQSVFEGTDYTRVAFEKKTQDGAVNGACDGIIKVQDIATRQGIKTTSLPPELVSGCNIQTDSTGNSLPFKKDQKCDQVFYKSLAPMLGIVFPVEIARQCSVTLDNHKIFDDNFKF